MTDRKLRVFLCHASQDKPVVRELYQRLNAEGWIDPWLDEEKLLPGQDWDLEIEKAVEAADVVLVCVSSRSVTKEGYIQREIKFALDIALEKPEGTIFIIPLRLDDCDVPRRLRSWQYVDYFPSEKLKASYQRLLQSLQVRFGDFQQKQAAKEEPVVKEVKAERVKDPLPDHVTISVPTTSAGIFDLGWTVVPILFFITISMYSFGITDSDFSLLVGIVAVLTGFALALRRQMIDNKLVKYTTIFFIASQSMVVYSDYYGGDLSPTLWAINGIVALIALGSRLLNMKSARKPATYSAIFLALFLGLFGFKLIINFFNIYTNEIQNPIIVLGIIASILMWLEQ